MNKNKMKYRSEVDGLRALAVVAVILFHAGVAFVPGGFLGVDVFFVISGFLITRILVDELVSAQFSIIGFYERRCRRILPALFFVLLSTTIASFALNTQSQFKDFSQTLVAVGAFSSNVLFWLDSGYFDSSSELKPLLHTWSLGVEEHYYIVVPVLLYFIFKYAKTYLFWIFVFLVILSFLLTQIIGNTDPNANFYLLPTRAWELGVGSLAALIDRRHQCSDNNFIASLSLTLIVGSFAIIDDSYITPGVTTIVPVVATGAILLFARSNTAVGKLLSLKWIVGIGLLSYSAYLWHHPLFAFARLTSVDGPGRGTLLLLSGVTFILAYISWKFIEVPFRDRKRFSTQFVTKFSITGLFTIIAFGLIGAKFYTDIPTGKLNPLEVDLGDYNRDNVQLRKESWEPLRSLTQDPSYAYVNNTVDNSNWFDLENKKNKLLIVGNSQSKDIYNMFRVSEIAQHFQIARFGVQIRDLKSGDGFFDSENYRNAELIVIATQYSRDDLLNLEHIIKQIASDNKNIAILTAISEFPDYVHGAATLADRVIAENYQKLTIENLSERVNQVYYKSRVSRLKSSKSQKINMQIKDIVSRYDNVLLLERDSYLCDTSIKQCYAVDDNLNKYFFDYRHHTLKGAQFFGRRIDQLGWARNLMKHLKNVDDGARVNE